MAKPLHTLLGYLGRLVGSPNNTKLADGQLLEQFVRQQDESAFAQLMHRHGPMVLGVCRRVLALMPDEAEDAFQAAFLVLARKAGSVRKRDSISSWLHGVAYRIALKARARLVQRRIHERQAATMPPLEQIDDVSWRELREVLDEELERLPEQYRTAFILCCLEEMTDEEAARQLGCPSGTIRSRLTRARELLRNRLTARGLTLSAAALAALGTQQSLSAAVPASLFTSTLKAASLFAANPASLAGIVSGKAVLLARSMLADLLWAKLKAAAVLFVVVAALSTTTGVLLHAASRETPNASLIEEASVQPEVEPGVNEPLTRERNEGGPPRGWKERTTITAHAGVIRAMAIAPDAKTVATASEDKVIKLWDLESGKELRTIRAYHTGPILRLAFSPDGKTIATAADDKMVRVWDVAQGRMVGEKHTGEVPAVVFLPDGGYRVTDFGGMVGRRWYQPPPPGTILVQQAAFSPDGALVASASSDSRIKVWDVAGKKELAIWDAKAAVTVLAFSNDNRLLASGGEDQTVRVWEARTGRAMLCLRGHEDTVRIVAYSPDGQILATGGDDRTIRVWQVADGQAKVVLSSPAAVQCLEFSADGKLLVAGGADGQLTLWGLQP